MFCPSLNTIHLQSLILRSITYLYLHDSLTLLMSGQTTDGLNHYAVTKFLEQDKYLNRYYGTDGIYIGFLRSSVYLFECSSQYNHRNQTPPKHSSGYRGEISHQYLLVCIIQETANSNKGLYMLFPGREISRDTKADTAQQTPHAHNQHMHAIHDNTSNAIKVRITHRHHNQKPNR